MYNFPYTIKDNHALLDFIAIFFVYSSKVLKWFLGRFYRMSRYLQVLIYSNNRTTNQNCFSLLLYPIIESLVRRTFHLLKKDCKVVCIWIVRKKLSYVAICTFSWMLEILMKNEKIIMLRWTRNRRRWLNLAFLLPV